MTDDDLDLSAALDQAAAAMRDAAPVVAQFYCALIKLGVKPDHACALAMPISEGLASVAFGTVGGGES